MVIGPLAGICEQYKAVSYGLLDNVYCGVSRVPVPSQVALCARRQPVVRRVIAPPRVVRVGSLGGTRAIDVRCSRCKVPPGEFCAPPLLYCRTRVEYAAQVTREHNAKVRKAKKHGNS